MGLFSGDVPLGWKVYVLAWTWFGVIAWMMYGLREAAVVWAFGASAGWLLAPTVRRQGWSVASRYLAASLVTLASLLVMIIGAARVESYRQYRNVVTGLRYDYSSSPRIPRQQRERELLSESIGLVSSGAALGILAAVLWNPRLGRRV